MEPGLFASYRDKILSGCTQVISGKDEVIFLLLLAFTCGGHVLLEDVPGTGKTMLLRAFAAMMLIPFQRHERRTFIKNI